MTASYVAERMFHALLVIAAVSSLVFVLTQMLGDPAMLLLPPEATNEDRARFRAAEGLDKPLPEQYARFMLKAFRGDFGNSFRHRQPALQLVLDRLPATVQLAAVATVIALVISIPLGIASALRRNSPIDYVARVFALLGQSTPSFFIGILLILIVAMQFRLMPASGRDGLEHLVMPAIALAAYPIAIVSRLLRSSLLEVLSKDYIRTAHAKGLDPRLVMVRHALKNAAIPVVTIIGLQMGNMLGGAIIVETVFAYPGMGLLAIQAISGRDFTVLQAFVAVFALCIVVMNFLVDLLYGILDPRTRYG